MNCVTRVIATAVVIFLSVTSQGFSEELPKNREELKPLNHIEILCCSWHHDRKADYNENNPGVFYLRDIDNRTFVAGGIFKNSLDNDSILLGVGRRWELSEHWDFRLIGGLVTGYSDDYPIVPAIMPTLEYRERLKIHIIPGVVYAVGFDLLQW